jgi:hypothetical protein
MLLNDKTDREVGPNEAVVILDRSCTRFETPIVRVREGRLLGLVLIPS